MGRLIDTGLFPNGANTSVDVMIRKHDTVIKCIYFCRMVLFWLDQLQDKGTGQRCSPPTQWSHVELGPRTISKFMWQLLKVESL